MARCMMMGQVPFSARQVLCDVAVSTQGMQPVASLKQQQQLRVQQQA